MNQTWNWQREDPPQRPDFIPENSPRKLGGKIRGVPVAMAVLALAVAAPAQTGFPWQNENLHYSINWQSGLSLGEANLSAHKLEKGWEFETTINAGVPGFAIGDRIHSMTTAGLCSEELDRNFSHGGKKTREKTTFDQKAGSAERLTLLPDGGSQPGKSTFSIPSCARDALAFLYYARMELGQGRVTPAQQVWFGSAYSVKTDYTGSQTVTVANKAVVTDHVVVAVRGPKSDFTFEVFYSRDPARTPMQIRIPLTLGTFTAELVR
jgi:hypothetical protein